MISSMSDLDWIAGSIDYKLAQVRKMLNEGQLEIREFDVAISILEKLKYQVEQRKQQSSWYRFKRLFKAS